MDIFWLLVMLIVTFGRLLLFCIDFSVIGAESHGAWCVHAEDSTVDSRGSADESVDTAAQMVLAILEQARAIGHRDGAVHSGRTGDQGEVIRVQRKLCRIDVSQGVSLKLG